MRYLLFFFFVSPLLLTGQSSDTTFIYHDNGKLSAKGILREGQKEGFWYLYDQHGHLAKKAYFMDGQVGGQGYSFTGKEIDYYSSGAIKQVKNWKNGILQGQQVAYYPNGDTLKTVFCDATGKFEGWLRVYRQNGLTEKETWYEQDYPIYTQFYDSLGVRREILIDHESLLVRCDEQGQPVDTVSNSPDNILQWDLKPVIYLYPEDTQEITVQLHYDGDSLFTYPNYGDGWNVMAYPNGKLINTKDGDEYSYLFWEGERSKKYAFNPHKGACVTGQETKAYLKKTFKAMGLTPKEYNELLVFWLPQIINNTYNYIHFLTGEQYNQVAALNVSPNPDHQLRVFMLIASLDHKVDVMPQQLPVVNRSGFVLIEWGGTFIQYPSSVNP